MRYSQGRRKPGRLNLPRIGMLLAIGVAGMVAAGRAGLIPDVSGAHPPGRENAGAIPPARTCATSASLEHGRLQGSLAAAYGDVLERLRAARSAELEREVLQIARSSVMAAVGGEEAPDQHRYFQSSPGSLDEYPPGLDKSPLNMPAGVFVTLVLDGRVRGCMGTVYPMEASLVEEIASSARMAATSDPRHPPVEPEEVPGLEYCVSVVGRIRRGETGRVVNPRREGVIVRAGGRCGIILPGEARTGAYEIAWAKREAGIAPGDDFELYVFETERFGKALPLRR